jgi:cytohesin
MQAALQGEYETVEILIEIGAAIDTIGEDGENALHLVCKHNRHEGFNKVLKLLLSKIDDNIVDILSSKLETPLSIALKMDFREHALLLLQRGANINCKGINNDTPLIRCAFDGRLDMLDFLVKNNADINVKNINDETALIVAAKRSLKDVIIYLINNGAQVDERDGTGKSALMWLCMICNDTSLIEYFVNDLHSNVNLIDNWGYTPLMFAVKATSKNSTTVIKLLIEKGSYINNVDKTFCSSLIYAAKKKKIAECKLLLDNGADPEFANLDGKTALDYLKKKSKDEIIEYISTIRKLGVEVKQDSIPTKPRWVNHLLENTGKNLNSTFIIILTNIHFFKGFVPWPENERNEKITIIDYK